MFHGVHALSFRNGGGTDHISIRHFHRIKSQLATPGKPYSCWSMISQREASTPVSTGAFLFTKGPGTPDASYTHPSACWPLQIPDLEPLVQELTTKYKGFKSKIKSDLSSPLCHIINPSEPRFPGTNNTPLSRHYYENQMKSFTHNTGP